ncbi:MAG: 4-hydroxyproline epimerase [Phycisphaeraceae bacterium]|nr:4-hydroxyproline epimerase [Phycisphaeraceae bacterium]
MPEMQTLSVIDSHTGGEPTRIVVGGAPDLGGGSMAERLALLRDQHDWVRRACVLEPRGNDVIVGAMLCAPVSPAAAAGVIFFNNVGYLHMCGHGTIGLAVTLAHLGRISPGVHTIETPVGDIRVTLHGNGNTVSIDNVPSYRHRKDVPIDIPSHGTVHGDIAWGGNWFFNVHDHGLAVGPGNIDALSSLAKAIRKQLDDQQITGENGGHIDHIELFGPPSDPVVADGRSFTLCPGGAYDRSPCGTGTSATVACLAADGRLADGASWRQQSVIGSVFEATYQRIDGHRIRPTITGSAYLTAESTVLISADDPLGLGITG